MRRNPGKKLLGDDLAVFKAGADLIVNAETLTGDEEGCTRGLMKNPLNSDPTSMWY